MLWGCRFQFDSTPRCTLKPDIRTLLPAPPTHPTLSTTTTTPISDNPFDQAPSHSDLTITLLAEGESALSPTSAVARWFSHACIAAARSGMIRDVLLDANRAYHKRNSLNAAAPSANKLLSPSSARSHRSEIAQNSAKRMTRPSMSVSEGSDGGEDDDGRVRQPIDLDLLEADSDDASLPRLAYHLRLSHPQLCSSSHPDTVSGGINEAESIIGGILHYMYTDRLPAHYNNTSNLSTTDLKVRTCVVLV